MRSVVSSLAALAAVSFVPALVCQAPPATKKVYDEAADARQQVATALAKAKRDNQRVLIQWGANWCGWCNWLAETMQKHAGLKRELDYEFQVVHVDVGGFDKHMDFAKELGAEPKSIPFLTILDADGKPLAQQNTEPFERELDGKKGHDARKIIDWLKQHEAEPLVAADVLAAAIERAGKAEKLAFVHFGAPWCGWCHRLEDWMARPEIAAVLAKYFVDVKIDNDRMTGGKDVYNALLEQAGQRAGGIPWFVWLDGDRKIVAHANGPGGNVGFPYQPQEVEAFGTMLRTAGVAADDVASLTKSLHDIREADAKARAAAQRGERPDDGTPDRHDN